MNIDLRKTGKILFSILLYLLAVQFIIMGILKLIGSSGMIQMYIAFGFGNSNWQRYVVGIIETIGGIGLLILYSRFLSALAIFFVNLILIIDVLLRYGPFKLPHPVQSVTQPAIISLALLLFVAWISRPQVQWKCG